MYGTVVVYTVFRESRYQLKGELLHGKNQPGEWFFGLLSAASYPSQAERAREEEEEEERTRKGREVNGREKKRRQSRLTG